MSFKKTIASLGMSTAILVNAGASAHADFKWTPYGFLKADTTGSTRGVESLGNMSLIAPTNASPGSVNNSARGALTFQVAQSRVGTLIENGDIKGQLEFDFINFGTASPTTQVYPRARILKVEYALNPNHKVSLGQEWDLFSSPEKPFTFNFVGLYFHAGNVGFMKQQFRYTYLQNDWEMSLATGLLSPNATSSNSEIELTGLPTLSARIVAPLQEGTKAGVSAIIGKVRPASDPTPLQGIYGVNTFLSVITTSGFQLREELYYGQNLGSAGMLSLANATMSGNRHEWGGYITALQPFSETFSFQGGAGFAKVVEAQGSAYTGTPNNNTNIVSNWKAELAFNYHPSLAIAFYVQPAFYKTAFISPNNSSTSTREAWVFEGGALYRF